MIKRGNLALLNEAEKEQIRKVNKMFYQVTENLDLEEIEYLVELLNNYIDIKKQQV